jgi:hypothetical protein
MAVSGLAAGPSAAARLADPHAELLGRAQRSAARLALDREGRREARSARGTARTDLAAALRARRRQVVLPRLEVALCEPAADADGDPVAERLAALLAQPVSGLSDAVTLPGCAATTLTSPLVSTK